MTTVLRLNTSILGDNSVSRQLADEVMEKLRRQAGDLKVIERDFANEPIPHLDGEWLQALGTPAADRTEAQQTKVNFSDTLTNELKAADIVLIALPMYNFSVPSMLKAWNDHVARAGVTFKYTDQGSVGLLKDKRVYLVAAMGGIHQPGESDFLRPYMQHFLGFLGIDDVRVITAQGLNMGEESRQQGLSEARADIEKLVNVTLVNDGIGAEEEAA